MQMNGRQGLQVILQTHALAFHEFEDGGAVFLDHPGELGFQGLGVSILGEDDIGPKRHVVEPVSVAAFLQGRQRGKKVVVEVGVAGYFFKDSGDLIIGRLVQSQDFSERVRAAKILEGRFFADYQGIGFGERRVGMFREQRDGEDIEQAGIGEGDPRLHE
jgi:hypothetical protein